MAQSPYLEYIPWISYPVPRSHHTIPLEPTTTPSPSGDTVPRVASLGSVGYRRYRVLGYRDPYTVGTSPCIHSLLYSYPILYIGSIGT